MLRGLLDRRHNLSEDDFANLMKRNECKIEIADTLLTECLHCDVRVIDISTDAGSSDIWLSELWLAT